MAEGKSDTAHLYDGKTIRSSAPSRKKAAGRLKGSTEIPKDAIPVSYTHLTLPTTPYV